MSTLERSVWWLRALATMVHVVAIGVAIGFGPRWLGPVIVGVLGVSVAVSVGAAVVLVGEVRGGVEGDLMLRSGNRIWRSTIARMHRAEQVETWVSLGALLAAVAVPAATGASVVAVAFSLIFSVPAMLLMRVIWWSRRLARSLMAAHGALNERDFARARALAEGLASDRRVPEALRQVAHSYVAEAHLRTGNREAALRSFEARWSGAMDLTAIGVARLRLGAGDAALARDVLASCAPTSVLEEFQYASLRAHLALCEGRFDEVLDCYGDLVERMPPQMADEVHLLHAAAHQALGKREAGLASIAQLSRPLQGDTWMPTTYPRLWRLYDDLQSGADSDVRALPSGVGSAQKASVAPTADSQPFAPPADDLPVGNQGRPNQLGAVPLEWLPIHVRRRWYAPWITLLLSMLLVPLGGILLGIGLVTLLSGVADPMLAVTPAIAVLALGIGVVVGASSLFEIRSRHSGTQFAVMGDGSRLSAGALRAVTVSGLARMGMLCLLLGFGPPTVELVLHGTAWSAMFTLVAAVVMAWAGWVRRQSQRLIYLLHFGEPGDAEAHANGLIAGAHPHNRGNQGALGLAQLWRGDHESAAATWREAAHETTQLWTMLAWLDVGRRPVDVQQVLRGLPGDALGARYRAAVLQGLVALHGGADDRVTGRRADWLDITDVMRNRFGGLLDLIIAALDEAGGNAQIGRAHLAARGIDLADYAWIASVWPFLWEGLTHARSVEGE